MRRMLFGCAISLFGAVASARGQEVAYRLLEETPTLGSNIRRDIVRAENLPLNKGYDELTPEQQGRIRDWYEPMRPGDEPPYPLHGPASTYAQVARGQQAALVDGELVLHVLVEPDGRASAVTVVVPIDNVALTRFVAALAIDAPYKPALCNATPCRMAYPMHVVFATRR